jgi:hypothetical protein
MMIDLLFDHEVGVDVSEIVWSSTHDFGLIGLWICKYSGGQQKAWPTWGSNPRPSRY